LGAARFDLFFFDSEVGDADDGDIARSAAAAAGTLSTLQAAREAPAMATPIAVMCSMILTFMDSSFLQLLALPSVLPVFAGLLGRMVRDREGLTLVAAVLRIGIVERLQEGLPLMMRVLIHLRPRQIGDSSIGHGHSFPASRNLPLFEGRTGVVRRAFSRPPSWFD